MKDIIWIRIPIPKDFSIKLDRHILDLKEMNNQEIPTKAELIIQLAKVGFQNMLENK